MTDSRPLTTDQTMTEEAQGRAHWRSKLWIAALALTILVSVIVIPPLVSITRYKTRIARAMSTSLGRPVRMSGVELRLLPRPEFVITDLIVDEDPTYGAEPVLHANSVTAAIRLFTLWRGRLEINRISVDEASLNLVRTTEGRWNLDTLFRTASHSQAEGVKAGRPIPLPYLEATNSRINIKRGFEKLPYSLVNADLSFWEENPGDWRIRLKGQPARTDVSLDQADTGIVQLEGRMRRAEELRLMPMHVEMEWREAQLGQLSRLLIGSDAGWRGDVTAEMKLDGTADAANVTTRLRATGVHREEFAPVAPLDFDANCGFSYHYSARTIEKLVCDSPLGDGHLRLEGNLPSDGQPKLSLELQKIPAQAVLDALRTVRQELGAGLEADGTLSGKLTYDTTAPPVATPQVKPLHRGKKTMAKQAPAAPGPLSGSVTVDALKLSGGALGQPIQIQKVVFEPSVGTNGLGSELAGTANVPAGAPAPLVFALRLTQSGYQVTARGSGSPARVRQ
ncbi:MAG: AsmA family protein, partial [Terracidiphilus sp.]